MTQFMFAVYDSKATAFCTPFFCPAQAVALRAFAAAVNDPQTNINKFPEDFTLFELGQWDDEKGAFLIYPQQVNLGLAANFRTRGKYENAIAQPSVGDAAHVQPGSEGGHSAQHV